MVAEPRSSDPVDPLSAYSGLTLFPRTFGVAPDPSKPYDPDADLDAIHNHLKSLALRKIKVGAVEDKESLQERRPALGRKRARFLLKPNLIQPAVGLEPSLDIEQLKDPEEFFLAYERLENAKRELQKQIGGVSVDLNQHNPSTTARKRRPGILGRSVRYKHRYSSVISENNENILSSQETFDSSIVSPTNVISQRKTDHELASKERDLAGSMDNPENKVSEILAELLSGNFEDLEGDGAVSILQKRLQIKPIDLEKLNLPELRDIQKIDLKSSRRNMPKPRKALADIDNLLKGISSKLPVKLMPEAENSFHHIASPTPPRNPFASLSLLQRQILSSNPSNDPFPLPDFGHSPAKNSSLTECMLKESDLDHTGMQLSNCDELKSPLVEEDDIDNLRQILHSKPSNDPFSIPDFGNSPAKNSSPIECMLKESDLDHTGMHLSNCDELKSPLVEEDDIATAKTGSSDVAIGDVTSIDEQLRRHDAQENGSNKLEDKVEDMGQEPVEAVASPERSVNMVDSTGETSNYIRTPLDLSSPAVVEDHAVHGLSQAPDNVPEQHIEVTIFPLLSFSFMLSFYLLLVINKLPVFAISGLHMSSITPSWLFEKKKERELEQLRICNAVREMACIWLNVTKRLTLSVIYSNVAENPESTEVSLNEQIKAKSRPHRERKSKERSHRKSLAGAGLLWKSGVRRSTRIRTRPLEYWKGERLLYGRIHQSLTTVIGLKYVSPTKGDDGKPALRVKSYVADEYKELVELAALH
ncbi:hypothetical protein SLA2020_432760 [Shorea laevis]